MRIKGGEVVRGKVEIIKRKYRDKRVVTGEGRWGIEYSEEIKTSSGSTLFETFSPVWIKIVLDFQTK